MKIFQYDIAHKPSYGAKPLSIIYGKVNDGYIMKHDGTKYLALQYSDKKYERIFDRIRYLVMLKSNHPDALSYRYTRIKINSDDDFLRKNIKFA